ncbi:MAG: hypothetical protein AAGC55_16555, partial [Myxococcota bacterium]
ARRTARPAEDEDEIEQVEALGTELTAALDRAEQAGAQVSAAAEKAGAAAAALPRTTDESQTLAARARTSVGDVSKVIAGMKARAAELEQGIASYVESETADAEVYLSAADAAIATGKLSAARRDLRKAQQLYKAQGKTNPRLHLSYGRLYDRLSIKADSDKKRLRYLKKAKSSYDTVVRTGSGSLQTRARERSTELAEELAEFDAAADE